MPTTYFVHIQRILKAVVKLVSSAHLHRFKPFKPRIDDGGGVVVAMMLLNAASALDTLLFRFMSAITSILFLANMWVSFKAFKIFFTRPN